MTEDEMVGWHHRLSGNEFEQTPGDSEGQGKLACCSPWGHKESDMTERLDDNTCLKERDYFSGIAFIRALIPLMRAPSSCSNHFPKAPPPNTISLGRRASTYEFGGGVGHRYSVSP